MKMAEILLIVFLTTLVLIILTGIFLGNYLYKLAINAHTDKSAFLKATPQTSQKSKDEEKKLAEEWFKSHCKTEFIFSFDNLKLNYYVIKSRTNSNKWVIMCHGYNGNALKQCQNAINFYNMGFNLLVPDARGHGKSQGEYIGMGWHDRLDIIKYINRIIREDSDAKIILYGGSMGASTVLMTSGENIPKNVKAVVADCGYSSAWDELSYQLKKFLYLPSFPFLNFMSFITKIKAGYSLEDADAIKQVKKCKIPLLIIHGAEDKFVPTKMADIIYNSASCEKEKLIVPCAAHVQSSIVNPALYWKTVGDFLEKYADI